MWFFWFIVISLSFLALVAFGLHHAGLSREKTTSSVSSQDRRADWMLFLNPRMENGLFVRNLKTNEQVFLPSPVKAKEVEISSAWIISLFSATVALGCLAGFVLYKLWDFLLKSF